MFSRFYLISGITMLLYYGWVAWTGTEFGSPARERIPADARQSPGGYRSFHSGYSGYRGGK
ncbi:MAG: hypothetical protein HOP18_01200 [Deltaproteobacteria bacterium]|nr:hypothetical protein [Deltaproteobacteria bacterium]